MSLREFRCFRAGPIAVSAGNATKPIPTEPPLVRSFDDFSNSAGNSQLEELRSDRLDLDAQPIRSLPSQRNRNHMNRSWNTRCQTGGL